MRSWNVLEAAAGWVCLRLEAQPVIVKAAVQGDIRKTWCGLCKIRFCRANLDSYQEAEVGSCELAVKATL